jgi:hypothetical protein
MKNKKKYSAAKFYFLNFFVVFLLSACFQNSLFSRERSNLSSGFYAGLSMGVLKVLAPADGRLYSGSGVVIGPGEVLTNCHVIRKSNRISVMKGAFSFQVTSVKKNIHRDLCLLEAPTLNFPAVNLRKPSDMRIGDMVYFYGYPGGADAFFTEGRISALHPMEKSFVVKTTAGFSSGGSGGGLFDGNGNLIGITTFFAAGHSGGYYALPSDWISELRSIKKSKVNTIDGLTFWEQNLSEQPSFLKFARYVSNKNWEKAFKFSSQWQVLEPSNYDALLAYGRSLMHYERRSEAIEILEKAMELAPLNANILFALEQALTGTKRFEKLNNISATLKKIDPDGVAAGKCKMAC